MSSNLGTAIVSLTCADQVLTCFHAQAVVENHVQLRHTSNLAVSPQGPQILLKRPNVKTWEATPANLARPLRR
jgi:hypothetical protein